MPQLATYIILFMYIIIRINDTSEVDNYVHVHNYSAVQYKIQ